MLYNISSLPSLFSHHFLQVVRDGIIGNGRIVDNQNRITKKRSTISIQKLTIGKSCGRGVLCKHNP